MFFRKNIALCKKNNPDGHFYYKKTFERAVYRRLCIMLSAMLMNFLAGAQLSFLQLHECAFYSNTMYATYSRASELLIVAIMRSSRMEALRILKTRFRLKCRRAGRGAGWV